MAARARREDSDLHHEPIESTFATVRHRTVLDGEHAAGPTKVTKGPGSKAAGLAQAFTFIRGHIGPLTRGERTGNDTQANCPDRESGRAGTPGHIAAELGK